MPDNGKKSAVYMASMLPVVFSAISISYLPTVEDKNIQSQIDSARNMMFITLAATILSKVSVISFTCWRDSSCHIKFYNSGHVTPESPNTPVKLEAQV